MYSELEIGWDEEKGYVDMLLTATYQPLEMGSSFQYHAVERGAKRYELKNHLGNVQSVITDKRILNSLNNSYTADVVSTNDYYGFGMAMPGRSYNGGEHRYGFQGQEMDNEIKGTGNSVNYKYRMHDPRIGRFFAVDPLAAEYAYNSPYAFSENRVVDGVELEGLEYAPLRPGYATASHLNRNKVSDKDVAKMATAVAAPMMVTAAVLTAPEWAPFAMTYGSQQAFRAGSFAISNPEVTSFFFGVGMGALPFETTGLEAPGSGTPAYVIGETATKLLINQDFFIKELKKLSSVPINTNEGGSEAVPEFTPFNLEDVNLRPNPNEWVLPRDNTEFIMPGVNLDESVTPAVDEDE